MAVPYTFGAATASIPLSQLDSNFATTITLGNVAVQLGNTVTSLTGVTNVASATSLTLGSNGNTTAVTIDSSQNVGVGVTPPTFNTGKALSIYDAGSSLWSNSNGALGMVANAYYNSGWKYQATAAAARFDVGNGNGTTTWSYAASGSAGAALTWTTAMTLDASGNWLVGTTSGGALGCRATISGDAGTNKWDFGPRLAVPAAFYVAANATYGVYLSSTTATSWSSASDERVKTDLQPIENAAEKVCSLRAVTGRYTADDSGVRKAFLIAQDVFAVLPEAVDTTDPEKYGLAYTDTIPLLVAAIKEQQALITQLQADVAALKGA